MKLTPVNELRARLISLRGRYPEIAESYGFSYSWLSKFARGARGARPSFDLILRLSKALDELDGATKPPVKRAA